MLDNMFSAIPDNLEAEVFEQLLQGDGVTIERIVSRGHRSPESGWYDQDDNEWVLVLKGAAIILFEDDEAISMTAGDFINIPAHRKHRVDWTDPDRETIWLAVHY